MTQRLASELRLFIPVRLIILWHSVMAAAGFGSVSNVLLLPRNPGLFPRRSYSSSDLCAALKQNASALHTEDTFHAAFQ